MSVSYSITATFDEETYKAIINTAGKRNKYRTDFMRDAAEYYLMNGAPDLNDLKRKK